MPTQEQINARVAALINKAFHPKPREILPGVEIERALVTCHCGLSFWFDMRHHAELCLRGHRSTGHKVASVNSVVEMRLCKPPVVGSNPTAGSKEGRGAMTDVKMDKKTQILNDLGDSVQNAIGEVPRWIPDFEIFDAVRAALLYWGISYQEPDKKGTG